MRILLTNDDGIQAPGLNVLENIARQVGGDDAEILVVAPSNERSGVAHCISYTTPMMITKISENRYSIDGNPADCVLAGIYYVLNGEKPDLILSGVNRGNNSAENVLYSGTIGAALEGALHHVTSIALSQYFGPQSATMNDPFNPSIAHGAQVVRDIIAHDPKEQEDYRLFYNVNFPPTEDVKGVRVVRQGMRKNTNFSVAPYQAKSGRQFLFVSGGNQHVAVENDTDAGANLDGYISLTPMRADLSAYEAFEHFKGIE